MMKRILRTVLGVVLAASVAACDEFAEINPETISFRMDGDAGTQVTLIVSRQFNAGINELGNTQVSVFQSDTLTRTLPVDTVFDIVVEKRFFVMAIPDVDGVAVQVVIDVDDRNIFNDEGDLFIEEPWRFVYLFNQLISNSADVVF